MDAPTRTAAVYIEAPYADVWGRLTDPKGQAAWNSAPGLEFGAAAGAPVAWGTPERTVYRGELLFLEKGTGFAHTFAFVGFGFDETTEVSVDVRAQGPVVLVSVRHDCTDAPRTHAMLGRLGWTKALCRLKTLLETGTAMPWPEEEEG